MLSWVSYERDPRRTGQGSRECGTDILNSAGQETISLVWTLAGASTGCEETTETGLP